MSALMPRFGAGTAWRSSHCWPLVVIGLGAVLFGTSCDARQDHRPDLLLVTIDTLRADVLGCYGGPAKTPTIDRLAAEGTLFEHATTPMPSTRPAHFSILTSSHPREHGVMSNASTLTADLPTLAEHLSDVGYETGAFTGVKLLAPGSGAERGFGTFGAPTENQRPAFAVVDDAIRWLETTGSNPRFLWVHVYDPHLPYRPSPAVTPPPGVDLHGFSRPEIAPLLRARDGDLPIEVFEYARQLYVAEVEQVDRELGRLIEAWPSRRPLAVVVTSDHGECFEQGVFFEHGQCLGEGALRVPMIVKHPETVPAGSQTTLLASLLDVGPTLTQLAGVPPPPEWQGSPVVPEDDSRPQFQFAEPARMTTEALERRQQRRETFRSVAGEPFSPILGSPRLVARSQRWKLLLTLRGPVEMPDTHSERLFDLATDPNGSVSIVAEHSDEVRRLKYALTQWLASQPTPERPTAPDEETKRLLESLGYR